MLTSCPITAFVATMDAEKAKAFYQGTLKLTFVRDDSYALVFDANGIMLRVSRVQQHTPPPFTVLGWKVPDIEAEIAELSKSGVAFQKYPFMPADGPSYFTFGDGTKVAWFKDPDGNTLSLTQFV
jgi:predicted enzyme related to lactoylglutathione lyase